MQLLDQYLTLYKRFAANGDGDAFAEASLGQVAEALYCTERNAKLVLRKLLQEGLIEWQAGRGRGNRSRLAFLGDKEELLFGVSREYAERGEFNKDYDLLRKHGIDTVANERFVDWMNGQFGICKEQGGGNDVLRLPIYQSIVTVDPAETFYSLSGHMILQLFDRLVQYETESGKIVPAIAHYWESNQDGGEWTLHLRKGILFHNGKELTAADVVFSMLRLKKGHRNSWITRALDRVEALSPSIVKFYLNKPNHLFLRYLCSAVMSIVPHDLAGETEERFWRQPIGTGPFQMKEWTEDRTILNANPHYYQGRPHLDSVHIIIMPQDDIFGRKTEEMSWQQLLCMPDQRVIKPENGWVQKESENYCTSVLTWNLNKEGPQQSAAFRRAIDMLIDRNAMIEELGGYREHEATGFFFNSGRHAFRDPNASRQLLEQAGYAGEPVTICTYGTHVKDVDWIQRCCAEAGVEVRVLTTTNDRIHDILNEADGIIHALVFPEEEVCLIENYEQDGSFVHELQDPEMLEWIENRIDKALAHERSEVRQAIYSEIEDRLRVEARVLFLLHRKFYTNYHPSFRGVALNSFGWIDFKDIWHS